VLAPLPGAAMLPGTKLAVTPAGNPATDSPTAELNAPLPSVETVTGADEPAVQLPLGEFNLSVNAGTVTVSAIGAVRVNPPPRAVTVIG